MLCKTNEELSDKIEYIRNRIEMIRLHKGYIRSKIEKISHNEGQSIDVAFKKMNPSLSLHIYEDITAGMVCIRTVLYTAHGMGQTEKANLETCLSGMTYPETRLSGMTDTKWRELGMLYPETRLSGMTDPETRLSGMTDPETRLSGKTYPVPLRLRITYLPRSLNKQQTYLNEYLQNNEEKTARNKYLIYLLMFGNIVCSGLLATSERGKLSSVLGYLLGNDGAHSYNGNGLPLTTMRKRTVCNEDILVPARPATLPMNVLFREPTNKEIAIIAKKIGREYIPLACFSGFGEAELDQLENDYPSAVPRNTRFLLRWRDTKDTNPTVKKLADAFRKLDFDPYIVYNSLETEDILPREFLQQELTDKEIARIMMKIKIMYVSLAILLGFTKAQLDEMRKVFNQVLKIFKMFKRRDAKTSIATIEKVKDVLDEIGIIPDIIYSSLDED